MRYDGNGESIAILLVEDNPGDVRLTMETLKESKVQNTVSVVTDGEQALSFLRQQGEYAGAERPDLVLLDLNLPRKDGREVLSEIKSDPELKRIPVVVLTSSEAESDILRSYDLHANAFVTKPLGLDQFIMVVKAIDHFWLSIVKLPND